MKKKSALLHRWVAQLEDYDFEILHRPGKNQGHVDALSRLPLEHVSLLGKGRVTLTTEEETRRGVGKQFIRMDIRELGKLYGFFVDDLRGLGIKCFVNQ